MRTIVSLGIAALLFSAATVEAQQAQKMKIPAVKMDAAAQKDAQHKMEAAKKDAKCDMEQNKKKMESMKAKKMHKSEEMKKEMHQKHMEKSDDMKNAAEKGSEQGQAMREEHSKKWWKFWDKEPSAE